MHSYNLMNNGLRSAAMAAALASLALAMSSTAALATETGVRVGVETSAGRDDSSRSSTSGAPVSDAVRSSGSNVDAYSGAISALGVLRATALSSGSSPAGMPFQRATALTDVYFSDQFVVSAPGHGGTATMHVDVLVSLPFISGTEAVYVTPSKPGLPSDGYAEAGVSIAVGGQSLAISAFKGEYSSRPPLYVRRVDGFDVTLLSGRYSLSVPITLGQPVDIVASARVSTLVEPGRGNFISAVADLGGTIYWDGIGGVVMADGTVLSDFSAIGSTGHDWAVSAVPEPGAGVLALLGLGVLAWRRRGLGPRTDAWT